MIMSKESNQRRDYKEHKGNRPCAPYFIMTNRLCLVEQIKISIMAIGNLRPLIIEK